MLVRALIFALAILLFFFYRAIFLQFDHNGDSASGYLRALDVAQGNWLLQGWKLPTDHFWSSDVWVHVALFKLFGENGEHMSNAAALQWTLVVLLSWVLSIHGIKVGERRWPLAVTALLIAFPMLWGKHALVFIGFPFIHIGSYAYTLLGYWWIARRASFNLSLHFLQGSVLSLIVTLSIVGDPMPMFTGWLPVCVYASLRLYFFPSESRHCRSYLGWTLLGILGGVLARALLSQLGMLSEKLPSYFVGFEQWPFTFWLGVKFAFQSFGCFLFGEELSARNLPLLAQYASRLPFLLAAFWLAYQSARRCSQAGRDGHPFPLNFLDGLLLTAIFVNWAILLTSHHVDDPTKVRLFPPTWLAMSLLLSRSVSSRHLLCRLVLPALLLTVSGFFWQYLPGFSKPPPIAPHRIHSLAIALDRQGIRQGFGDFWDTHILEVLTRRRVRARALIAVDGQLRAYCWQSPYRWYELSDYQPERFFVIARQGRNSHGFSEEVIEATFGPPAERFRNFDDEILIYNWPHPALEALQEQARKEAREASIR